MADSFEELIEAYRSCRGNKRNSNYALDFEFNWESRLCSLEKRIGNETYKPGYSTCFVITYPTVREVFAAEFMDRVVHHYLINKIEPKIDKTFINDSYACRRNHGSIAGALKLRKYLNKITRNQTSKAYFMQLDIKSFFYNIDKTLLYDILINHVKKLKFSTDEFNEISWLSQVIIFNDPSKHYIIKGDPKLFNTLPKGKSLFTNPPNKGLPIGNLTSQFFANLYLNEVDQFIKRELKIKYYLRYADDMILLSDDKDELFMAKEKIQRFLEDKLILRLKDEKTKFGSVYDGIDFLGYFVKPNYVLSRKRVVSNLKKKLYYFNSGFLINRTYCNEEAVPLHNPPSYDEIATICSSINSLFGHLKWANSFNLRQDIYNNHLGMLKEYLDPKDDLSSFNIKSDLGKS